MNHKHSFILVSLLATLVLVGAMTASAGVTGKIAGSVTDATTGEPIIGATVRVDGTNLGTKTDEEGEFFIINIPSGKFDIVVTTVGYESETRANVRVLVDLTTPVSFELNVAPVEVAGTIVVQAKDPLIQADLTESKTIFTSDKLRSLPNSQSVAAVLNNYPGVVTDNNANIHVRGGRAGQTTYYYDDFLVQDLFVDEAGIFIAPDALSELSLSSGGYTAEYGGALSAVLNAVTPEGSDRYKGNLKVFQGATHPYDVEKGEWKSLQTNAYRSMFGSASGPINPSNPRFATFYVAGEYRKDPTYLPQNWNVSKFGVLKLAAQPLPTLKLKSHYTYWQNDGRTFTHRDQNGLSYDLNLDGLPRFEKKAYVAGLSANFAPNERTVLSANAGRFYTYTKIAPDKLFDTYWDQWPGYSEESNGTYNGTIDDDNYSKGLDPSDPRQSVGFAIGDNFLPRYVRRAQWYNTGSFSITSQTNRNNQFKIGAEFKDYVIEWDDKQFYNSQPYGEIYKSSPLYTSGFVHNKMEYANIIINAGIRYDHRNDEFMYRGSQRSAATDVWSPRLGISFPISEKSVMHFNYGFYYQMPRFPYLYTNLNADYSTGLPLVGNPFLKPEEDVMYELGLDHVIGEDLRLDVTAFFKDIRDLVTTRDGGAVAGNRITVYDNGDYGSAKGFDIAVEKLKGDGNFTASIAYGYLIATGNSSYATEPYYTYLNSINDSVAPVTEYPLDFDQRHTATAAMTYIAPRNWDQRLFGVKMPTDWRLTLIGQYGSGMPYTRTDSRGNRLGERNEGRFPATFDVDMGFEKGIAFFSGTAMSFFIQVDNLLNRKNVIAVYTRTGLATNDGARPGGGFATNQAELDRFDKLYDHDPQNFAPPRTIRTGLEFTF
ncbi:MAG: TonB-dependent receptor [Candidatus Zixiibacteriota bacterium]